MNGTELSLIYIWVVFAVVWGGVVAWGWATFAQRDRHQQCLANIARLERELGIVEEDAEDMPLEPGTKWALDPVSRLHVSGLARSALATYHLQKEQEQLQQRLHKLERGSS